MGAEILQANPAIIERCNELLNAKIPDVYKSPNVYYLFEKKLDLLDQILVTKTDPSMCSAEGHDTEVEKESSFVVVTRDSERFQCYQEDDQIKVDILTPEGYHLKTELKHRKDGKFVMTYIPHWVGQHSFEIQVNGQPLSCSPCVVQVHGHHRQFAFKFGSKRKRGGAFDGISGVAVNDKTGTIAVAGFLNKRIQFFSSDGKFQREVKLDDRPISVAFTDDGGLLTLVSGRNNKLCLFSEEGQFIENVIDKHLNRPQYLSIASDGRLIVTDWANNEVKLLSPDGNDLLLSFLASNSDEYPDCAVYHKDKFYISYPEAHCIKVFDKTGLYLHDMGCKGSN